MLRNLIVLPDGTELFSGSAEVPALKNVKITECVNSGTELTLGSTCANMIEVSVVDPSGTFSLMAGDEVLLYKVDDSEKRHKVGIFLCEKPTRPTANTVKFIAYDRVILLDKDLTDWLNALDAWPYKMSEFADMVCEACGLTLIELSHGNRYFSVNKFTAQGVTGRQIMQWIGEIIPAFFRATSDGEIEMAQYEVSGRTITPAGDLFYYMNGLSFEDYRVEPVDAVQIQLADSNEGYLWPEASPGANSYVISGNPILNANITDTTLECLDVIKRYLSGITYTPCKISIPATRDIHAGDIVNIIDKNGKVIRAYVMTKTQSGQKDTLECTGSPRRDSATAQYGQPVSTVAASAAQNAVNGMTPLQVFNKLTNNGQYKGIYMLDGQLYINGTYVQTGQLDAEKITLSGDFSVYSGDTLGGHVGYMSGSDGETVTDGIGVRSADEASYVIATDAGIRMQSGTFRSYIVKDKRFVIEGDLWCKGNMQLKSLTPYADGDMEWRYIDSIGATVLVKTGA